MIKGGYVARPGILPEWDTRDACDRLYQNAVDRARVVTGRQDYHTTRLIDMGRLSGAELKAKKATLLRRYPTLLIGSHGQTILHSPHWQPLFVIINREWDTPPTPADVQICIVAWTHVTSHALALDFLNTHVPPGLTLDHMLLSGARVDAPLLGRRMGNSFMDAMNRFSHDVEDFLPYASEYEVTSGVTLYLRGRPYRVCWSKPDGDDVTYTEGRADDASDLDRLVLKDEAALEDDINGARATSSRYSTRRASKASTYALESQLNEEKDIFLVRVVGLDGLHSPPTPANLFGDTYHLFDRQSWKFTSVVGQELTIFRAIRDPGPGGQIYQFDGLYSSEHPGLDSLSVAQNGVINGFNSRPFFELVSLAVQEIFESHLDLATLVIEEIRNVGQDCLFLRALRHFPPPRRTSAAFQQVIDNPAFRCNTDLMLPTPAAPTQAAAVQSGTATSTTSHANPQAASRSTLGGQAQPFINEDTAWANIRSQFDQLLQESIRRALELQTAEHEATAADYEKAKTELRQTQTVLQRAEARANALQQRIAELEKIAHDATRQTEKVQAENTRLHDLLEQHERLAQDFQSLSSKRRRLGEN